MTCAQFNGIRKLPNSYTFTWICVCTYLQIFCTYLSSYVNNFQYFMLLGLHYNKYWGNRGFPVTVPNPFPNLELYLLSMKFALEIYRYLDIISVFLACNWVIKHSYKVTNSLRNVNEPWNEISYNLLISERKKKENKFIQDLKRSIKISKKITRYKYLCDQFKIYITYVKG